MLHCSSLTVIDRRGWGWRWGWAAGGKQHRNNENYLAWKNSILMFCSFFSIHPLVCCSSTSTHLSPSLLFILMSCYTTTQHTHQRRERWKMEKIWSLAMKVKWKWPEGAANKKKKWKYEKKTHNRNRKNKSSNRSYSLPPSLSARSNANFFMLIEIKYKP